MVDVIQDRACAATFTKTCRLSVFFREALSSTTLVYGMSGTPKWGPDEGGPLVAWGGSFFQWQ